MRRRCELILAILTSAVCVITASPCVGDTLVDAQAEFFETRIRPVLAEACYSCHNSADAAEADLAVDHRDGIRATTEHGTAVVPGDINKSLLLKVIRHEIEGLEMPEDGAKLTDDVIADFERWVRIGAPDPRDVAPTDVEIAKSTSWPETLKQRKQWWSLQPIQSPPVPAGDPTWSKHPIDRFIAQKQQEHDLQPAADADPRTLARRLSYAILGLPPSRDQIDVLVTASEQDRDEEINRLVDEMLDSPHFGERWARHWMDLVRYADSHGSEGDPTIPHAYRYRDYLIRALNDDIPYDQLVREHIAGDLLGDPRINDDLGINESQIGPAHLRFVFHGFAPTDPLDEKVRFTDDQINVISKAFLGLTVSCARCHDHKFDAISQADYYAMFGILASCRPALVDVNRPDRKEANKQRLREIKDQLRHHLARRWIGEVEGKDFLPTDLEAANEQFSESRLMKMWVDVANTIDKETPFAAAWQTERARWHDEQRQIAENEQIETTWHWDLANRRDYDEWFPDGNGLPEQPSNAGDFRMAVTGNTIIDAILPAGIHAGSLSTKHRAFLASPRFLLDDAYNVWLRVQGDEGATVRYCVENYPRNGTVYPISEIKKDRWHWQHYNLDYWQGDHIHLEIATGQDAPLQIRGSDRSWFGIREVVVRKKDLRAPPADTREFLGPIFDAASLAPPTSLVELTRCYQVAIANAIHAWGSDKATDAQAILLEEALRDELLGNTTGRDQELDAIVDRYRNLEADIPTPTRVPGVVEADAFDQPLFDRGNHRKPTTPVRRRFLESIDSTPYETENSGRLLLADDLVRTDNPLTSRVMINRIWHHLFGRGIVDTPDNLGRLGSLPSHPELLDYLARRFQDEGWSIKNMVRLLVTSKTWQQSSVASAAATEIDPSNRWLSHANVRRLDAESLRDTMLVVAGRLDPSLYGPSFRANSNATRRAVYVTSKRNSLDAFLSAFDSPVPFAPTGRRSETNVPAQSLTLLNDPMVMRRASDWAKTSAVTSTMNDRVGQMFQQAFGRPPSAGALSTMVDYVNEAEEQSVARQLRRERLEQQHAQQTNAMASILDPVRKRLELASAKTENAKTEGDQQQTADATNRLVPIAAWDFETDLRDSIGQLDGSARGNAKVSDGALVLDGESFVVTKSIGRDLKEKTLEVSVQLSTVQQRGGGAITVQTLNGGVFDSLVFAERESKQWMAGSNGFVRTDNFGGRSEDEAAQAPVHFAIAYDTDGTIRGYRNGHPYGQSIRKSGRVTFRKGNSQILFGLRHGEANPSRMLSGRIFSARLYDRALSSEEIRAAADGANGVSESAVIAELSPSDRAVVAQHKATIAAIESELKQLNPPSADHDPWTLLAHALFNMKEFTYIR